MDVNTWDDIGTEAYSPVLGPTDPVTAPRQESTQPDAHFLADNADNDRNYPLSLPSPSVGGRPGEFGRLAWSKGLGAFRMRNVNAGQSITPPATALTVGGPVGFHGKGLAGRLDALYSDYTPSASEVAQDWLTGW